MSFDKETLWEKLTLVESQFQEAREENHRYKDLHVESIGELYVAMSKADTLISSYQEDASTANARSKKVSDEVELELTWAPEYAWLRSQRHVLDDVHIWAIDLSAKIKKVKALEKESVLLHSFDEGWVSG